MRLGLKRDEVRVVPYTSEWQAEFKRVQDELVASVCLSKERIEHIGSTAIQGIDAKPILDILVGVDDFKQADKQLFQSFSRAGFLRLKVERPNEIVLAKFSDDTYEEKTHFIHLVEYKGDLWQDLLFFRDYLNEHKEAKERYQTIKHEYLKKTSTGIAEYTDSKELFVKEIIEKRRLKERQEVSF